MQCDVPVQDQQTDYQHSLQHHIVIALTYAIILYIHPTVRQVMTVMVVPLRFYDLDHKQESNVN